MVDDTSGGYGYRPMAHSMIVRPRLHMSLCTLYVPSALPAADMPPPEMRSGAM
jgi:hypothetical protein